MAHDEVPVSAQRRQQGCAHSAKTAGVQGFFTIKEVGDACGLPGPVIAQLVPRTWVEQVGGWMYTAAQLDYAVSIRADVLNGNHRPQH